MFFFLAFFCFSTSAPAVELPSINKSKIRLLITPGETKHGEILVENPTAQEKSMRLYLEDWYYLPAADGSKEFVAANTTPLSCASWVRFSPSEFTVAAFGRQKVNYSVEVPPQAQGGRYAVLFFENALGKVEAGKEEMKAGMNVVIRIATLFYVEPLGTIKRIGLIDNLTFKKGATPNSSIIQLEFYNTGNVDITCGGTFHIMNKEGIIYARGEFKNVYTFPDKSGNLVAECRGIIPKGKYDLVMTFDLGKALEEDDLGRGPVIIKEAEIEIGENSQILKVGRLK